MVVEPLGTSWSVIPRLKRTEYFHISYNLLARRMLLDGAIRFFFFSLDVDTSSSEVSANADLKQL